MLIAAAVVLTAAVMASCNGEGCYKITMKSGESQTVTYVYGNSEDVDAAIEKAKAAATLVGADFDAHRQKVNKSEEDCK